MRLMIVRVNEPVKLVLPEGAKCSDDSRGNVEIKTRSELLAWINTSSGILVCKEELVENEMDKQQGDIPPVPDVVTPPVVVQPVVTEPVVVPVQPAIPRPPAPPQ